MYFSEAGTFPWWWLCPLMMVIFCFIVMRGHRGTGICGCGPRSDHGRRLSPPTAKDILDRRFAEGEIERDAYDEKLRVISASRDIPTNK